VAAITYSRRAVLVLVAGAVVAAIVAAASVFSIVERTVAVPGQVRVGVMPFRPAVASPSDQSIADAILQGFSGTSAAFVGPTTTARYDGDAAGIRRLAEDFGLDYVLNGQFGAAEGDPRLLAVLIRTSDGAQVWTGRYDDLNDGARIGREISEQVVRVLALRQP
jgi:TolB-like protein